MIDSRGSHKGKPGSATIFSSFFYCITLFSAFELQFQNKSHRKTPIFRITYGGFNNCFDVTCYDNLMINMRRRLHLKNFGLCDRYTVGGSNS